MPLGAGGWELAGAMAIVLLGGMVQGSIGFGLNLMVVPVLALLIPGSVPGSMILLSMPMTLTMLLREHHAIDWLGRAAGSPSGGSRARSSVSRS